MTTLTRNRHARKARRTRRVTAHRLRPGHRLTSWGTGEPVTVVDVVRTGQRSWTVTVALPCGALESAPFTAGQPLTREL